MVQNLKSVCYQNQLEKKEILINHVKVFVLEFLVQSSPNVEKREFKGEREVFVLKR